MLVRNNLYLRILLVLFHTAENFSVELQGNREIRTAPNSQCRSIIVLLLLYDARTMPHIVLAIGTWSQFRIRLSKFFVPDDKGLLEYLFSTFIQCILSFKVRSLRCILRASEDAENSTSKIERKSCSDLNREVESSACLFEGRKKNETAP